MAKLVECDACGKTSTDESRRIISDHPIPHGTTGYGGNGWMIVNLTLMRTLEPRDYPEHMLATPSEGPHTTLLYTALDLCPECGERVMLATGCLNKIVREVQRRRPEPEAEREVRPPTEPREPGRTGWARVVEDKDDDDAR